MRIRLRVFCSLAAAMAFTSLGGASAAWAAALAYSDVEIALRIGSVTPGSTVSFIGSGVRQVDFGPLPGAVNNDLNLLSIAGTSPANHVQVPMSVGQRLTLDAQAGVRSDTLALGQSARIQIDLAGLVSVLNSGATDATITFNFEREYFFNVPVDDPTVEFARAQGLFAMQATSFDATGSQFDSFFHEFNRQIEQGANYTAPQDHFDFKLMVPSGGTATVEIVSFAISEVALVPEPSTVVLIALGAASIAMGGRRGRLQEREFQRQGR